MIGNAVKVMRIATGEEEEELPADDKNAAAKELGAKGGKKRAANRWQSVQCRARILTVRTA
ncbi:MAG: hypothetical protein WDZ83_12540 [Rhizobiaceae bacterium]